MYIGTPFFTSDSWESHCNSQIRVSKLHPCSCYPINQQTELPRGNRRLKAFLSGVGDATFWKCSREGAQKQSDGNQRSRLIEHLLSGSKGGKLRPGDLKNAAKELSCSRYQVMGVWKRYNQQKENGVVATDLRNRRRGNSGREGFDLATLNEAL